MCLTKYFAKIRVAKNKWTACRTKYVAILHDGKSYFVRHIPWEPMESCVFLATTFCRHFLWDKKVCHLFHETSSHLFFETSAYKRRPIFEFTNLNRTTRKGTHRPSSFLQGYCRKCVFCAVHLKWVHSEPIQMLLRPKSTRQDSNKRGCVFPFPFPVWFWFCWWALLILWCL